MKYFRSVVEFVDRNLLWIAAAFLLACFVEFIIYLFRRRKGFDNDKLFICIATNLVVTLGLYIAACLCVGFVNCLMDQDWHFFSNYMKFLGGSAAPVIFGIILVGAFIYCMFRFDFDSIVGRIIASALAAALATLVAMIAGFIIYVVIALVIIILKLIWFVVSGFFISIFQFIVKYWQMSVFVLVCPGVLYGACYAFINYIGSFSEEVMHR